MKNLSKIRTLLFCFLAFGAVSQSLFANEAEAGKSKEFDAKELIMEHVLDSYEWHMATINDFKLTIPLPVILFDAQGAHVFMSSKLEEGEYQGFYISQSEKYKGKIVEKDASGAEIRPWDFSITKNVLSLLINSTILLLIVLSLANFYNKQKKTGVRKAPRGFMGLIEIVIMSIEKDVVKACIGKNSDKFSPYIHTVFLFILINNWMGLIPFFPGGANVTGNITITFIMAMFSFVLINLYGTKEYWKDIFWPDVPTWLKVPVPFMPVIEFVGVFTKPFALMIRLFANILAGHAISISLICLIFMTVSQGVVMNTSMTVVSIILSLFMGLIEVLLTLIQAYVFAMLSAVFIGMAQIEPHKQPAKH